MKTIEGKWTIKLARQNSNLSQEEIAKKMSISRTMYRKYENGEIVFRMDKAWIFSKIVKLPMESIIFFDKNYTSSVSKHKQTA